jgi:hypothetical protein
MRDSENIKAQKEKTISEKRTDPGAPPNGGQVPVAMPMPMVGAPESMMAEHPDMPMTQVYAPQISLAALLILMTVGMIIFRKIAEKRRLAKKCPHCGMGLERWADQCGMCKESIFVYPSTPVGHSK